MNELVSVAVPAYNVGEYIEECLKSICSQTYKNLEIIVVDDGSVDDTYDICKKVANKDDRIEIIKQENQGVVLARRTAIEAATGKYIAFVDGDDWIDKTMIESMVNSISDADLVSVGVLYQQKNGRFTKRRDLYDAGIYSIYDGLTNIYCSMVYDLRKSISHSLTTWLWNKLYLTDKVKEIYVKINPILSFSEDAVFVFMYLLECKKIILTDSYFYYYRYREGSALHRTDIKRLEKINQVYVELYNIFKETPKKYKLIEQLNLWLLERNYIALNEHMDIDKNYRIIRYMADTRDLDNKKIIIYGAGRVGQDVFFQLKKLRYNVVLWCDASYMMYRQDRLPVSSVEKINKTDFDLMIIAVEDIDLKRKIIDSLNKKNISTDKVCDIDIFKIF